MRKRNAFTLVELLVVIGIIALLAAILLPALTAARAHAYTIKCAANLHSIGEGLANYLAENRGYYPQSSTYYGTQVSSTSQTPDNPSQGYVHWSAFLYRGGKWGDRKFYLTRDGWEMFQCPAIETGGLPPSNTYSDNLDPGQQNESGAGVIDYQAPRNAYTLNEAICGRGKFVKGFQGAMRVYRFVQAARIRDAANTILATEFNPDWHIIQGGSRYDGGADVPQSHRPVHGFVALTGQLDLYLVPAFGRPAIRRATADDLSPNPQENQNFTTRLDWVGRNHGGHKPSAGYYDTRLSNFLYVDGHVETKQVRDTLRPFQWGREFYSLNPGNDIIP